MHWWTFAGRGLTSALDKSPEAQLLSSGRGDQSAGTYASGKVPEQDEGSSSMASDVNKRAEVVIFCFSRWKLDAYCSSMYMCWIVLCYNVFDVWHLSFSLCTRDSLAFSAYNFNCFVSFFFLSSLSCTLHTACLRCLLTVTFLVIFDMRLVYPSLWLWSSKNLVICIYKRKQINIKCDPSLWLMNCYSPTIFS